MKRVFVVLAVVLGLGLVQTGPSVAAWISSWQGNANVSAAKVKVAGQPSATQNPGGVTLTWPQVTLTDGTPVTGYVVRRTAGSGSVVACTATEPSRTCVDNAPLPGTVTYDVTPTFKSWTGGTSTPVSFTLDQTPPAAPSSLRISNDTGASSTDGITRAVAQSLLGSAEPGSTVEVTLDGTVVGSGTTAANGTFSVPMGSLIAGQHSVSAVAVDGAGNRSNASAPLTVKVDLQAPAPVITFPVNGSSYKQGQYKNGCAPTQDAVCGTASDPAYTAGLSTVTVKLTGPSGTCADGTGAFTAGACTSPPTATGTASWSLVTGVPPSGAYTLQATAYDLAGNSASTSVAFTRN